MLWEQEIAKKDKKKKKKKKEKDKEDTSPKKIIWMANKLCERILNISH